MNYNVYLVEDEYMLREYVKASTIWKNGPYVLCGDASNGEDAWEDIQALSVDILLTDIKMPFMDGLELSRLIRKNRPEIRVIILSGYDDFSYAKQALALGVTDYLLKPLKPEDLLNTLQRTAQMIDAERRQIQSMRTLQEIANESLELNCHKFFAQLCRGFLSEQRISSELQRLHLRMDAACYSGCILALHELGKAETDDEAYCIRVTDSGKGIPAAELTRITEAFYMVDKSRARAQGGAGLGLTVCQRIIELHGGAMEFRSIEGEGTQVCVHLKGGTPA